MKTEEINFGDLGFYTAGGGLPEGKYALEFEVQMYQATKQDGTTAGPPRLGVMVTAHSLTDTSAEPKTQFYSMGSKAHESFAPNPDTGKGLVAVGGSGGSSLNLSTNWAFFLKHFYDCGLPPGLFINDLTVIDGVWVHVIQVPEPEDRKGFATSTAEVEQTRRNNKIAVPSEILEGGAPWDGGGGIPEKTAPKPAAGVKKPAVKAAAKPAVKAAAKPAAKASPAPAAVAVAEGLDEIALVGITSVLEKNPNGCNKLILRTGTFKSVAADHDNDTANTVLETFFGTDEALNGIIEQLGYSVSGQKIVPNQ